MNIIDDLLATRDRIDDAIKALQAIGLKPTGPKIEIPLNPKLSERETEVLTLLAEGITTQEAGKRLSIDKKTIEAHRDNIRKKLGIQSSHDLIRMVKEGRI